VGTREFVVATPICHMVSDNGQTAVPDFDVQEACDKFE